MDGQNRKKEDSSIHQRERGEKKRIQLKKEKRHISGSMKGKNHKSTSPRRTYFLKISNINLTRGRKRNLVARETIGKGKNDAPALRVKEEER